MSDQPDTETFNWRTSLSPAGSELAITESERPQTHALDRAATGIGWAKYLKKTDHLKDVQV